MHKARLVYPMHRFDPKDFLRFVEMKPFEAMWPYLGFEDDDLLALQVMITADPQGPPVVPGTGGARKVRFGRADSGKSGGVRVWYGYFEKHNCVALLVVYPKSQKENLTAAEKKRIQKVMEEIERILDSHC